MFFVHFPWREDPVCANRRKKQDGCPFCGSRPVRKLQFAALFAGEEPQRGGLVDEPQAAHKIPVVKQPLDPVDDVLRLGQGEYPAGEAEIQSHRQTVHSADRR